MKKKEERNYNRRYAKEYNFWRSLWYMTFLYFVAVPFFSIFYNYTITGQENLPKSGDGHKYIYTANHVSIFDPFLVPFATKKLMAFMAKKELFEENNDLKQFKNLIISLGAFAVDRTKPEIATFKTVKDIFTTKWALAVFPQGGTRPYGKLDGIKRGFVAIAKAAKADIVPVAIADFSGYPKLKPFTRQTVNLHICKPISYELSTEEILYRWCEEISLNGGYEHDCPKPESLANADKEEVSV